MEYHIEHKRDLTDQEIQILHRVLSMHDSDSYLEQIDSLKIVARCGCGMCPTVFFGQCFEDEPISNGIDLVQFQGVNADGEVVGVTVMALDGKLTELEASSFSGGNISSWPPVEGLEAVNA